MEVPYEIRQRKDAANIDCNRSNITTSRFQERKANMIKALNSNEGFTLIELAIVAGIIGVLGAIAVPSYLGTLQASRDKAMIESTSSSIPEMRAFIEASLNGETGRVDVDGNGVLDILDVAPANATVITDWITLHSTEGGDGGATTAGFDDVSPYNNSLPLFADGGLGVSATGQIYLIPILDNGGNIVGVSATAMSDSNIAGPGQDGKLIAKSVVIQ